MTYQQRLSLLIAIDTFFIITSIILSNYMFREQLIVKSTLIATTIILVISYHLFSFKFKLYKKVWEYASIGELITILKIVTFSSIIAVAFQFGFTKDGHIRYLFVDWLLLMFFIGGSRFYWRVTHSIHTMKGEKKKRTLIIGAGDAGTMIVRQLQKNENTNLLPVAFIDDDLKKYRCDILGIPVVGGSEQIEVAVQKHSIEHIIIAIPSLRKKDLNKIFQECAKTNVKTQKLPLLEDIITGKISVNQFRDVQVEDLLGREEVELDINSISSYITNKVVLVTGAGGSIGSEICRQVLKFNPSKLVLLGHGENSIYMIEMELKHFCIHNHIQLVTEIADIQDQFKMNRMMEVHKPDVVYHAAAHKHVPLMEQNPEEAVKNNMIGTMNAAFSANLHGVKTFVMISSDKAVNPSSVMGATKRLAEMIIQDMNKKSNTKFLTVRFGNVLGSRGSVIPLFKKQIQAGGPVTVTHPDMVRYFMTIPEAAKLVIQAGSLAQGGETFVLDMGSPVKIVDLAKDLIKLSGNSVEEIGVIFTGMREGEKLFEELFYVNEVQGHQVYPKIHIGKTFNILIAEIEEILSTFSDMDKEVLKQTLLALANKNASDEKVLSV